jgi:hypothetical protein
LSTAPTPNNRKQTEENQREKNRTRRQTEREKTGGDDNRWNPGTATNETGRRDRTREGRRRGEGLGRGDEEGRGRGALPALFRIQSANNFFQVASRYPRNLRNSITIYFSGYRINEEISFFEAFWPSTEVLSSFDNRAVPGYRAFSSALDQLISQ